MRRCAGEDVAHHVDVHAAAAEARTGRLGSCGRVRADEHVGALEHTGVVHDRLRGRGGELLGWRAVDRHGPGRLGAREELRDRERGGHADGTLRAVLVAVKVARGPAQRVVLDDDAEIRTRRPLLVARDEGGLQASHSGRHVEVVRLEILGEDLHRPLFLPAGLGVAGDVVGHREELLVHELLGAGQHGVAAGIAGAGEPRHERGQRKRALQRVHAADDIGRGTALGGRFLGGQRRGDEGDEGDEDWERWGGAHQI